MKHSADIDISALTCVLVLRNLASALATMDSPRVSALVPSPPGLVNIPGKLSCTEQPYSITVRRVPELILVLGSQPAGDMSHKPGGRLPLLSARRPPQPLRGLLPILLLGEQRHNGCEQFA